MVRVKYRPEEIDYERGGTYGDVICRKDKCKSQCGFSRDGHYLSRLIIDKGLEHAISETYQYRCHAHYAEMFPKNHQNNTHAHYQGGYYQCALLKELYDKREDKSRKEDSKEENSCYCTHFGITHPFTLHQERRVITYYHCGVAHKKIDSYQGP